MTTHRYVLPILSVCLLALSACSPSTPTSGEFFARIGQTQNLAQTFPAAYSQTVQWQKCAQTNLIDEESATSLTGGEFDLDTFECATIEAPLNWDASAESDTETISLAVSRIRATQKSTENEAIFVNPGGPGEGGLLIWAQTLASGQAHDLAQHFDLIGFDPRGIGQSTPLECQPIEEDEELGSYLSSCASDNPVAAHMGTTAVARDMELMRHLLGLKQLNYLGYSYGTMLGATYATLFPRATGRMVLDSAEDSQWATPQHLWQQQVAIANALVDLTKACVEEYQPQGWLHRCPFTTPEEAAATINRLNATPLQGSDGTPLTGEDLRAYLSQGLYEPEPNRTGMLAIVTEALNGKNEFVDLIIAGAFLPPVENDTPESEPGINEEENANSAQSGEEPPIPAAQLIVTCHSYPAQPQFEEVEQDINNTPDNPLLDTSQSSSAIETALDPSCTRLPFVGSESATRYYAGNVATPILVIGVRGDHATPYQYAQSLVNELGNAQLLTMNGRGHGISYGQKSTCVDHAVSAYFLDGKLPQITTCEPDPLPSE